MWNIYFEGKELLDFLILTLYLSPNILLKDSWLAADKENLIHLYQKILFFKVLVNQGLVFVRDRPHWKLKKLKEPLNLVV